jgi:hypothetical protein
VRKQFSGGDEHQDGDQVHRESLTPKQTVDKLIAILDANSFENGDRVDYFD